MAIGAATSAAARRPAPVAAAPAAAPAAAAVEVARYADPTRAVAADPSHLYVGHGRRILAYALDGLPAAPPVATIGPLPGVVAALGRLGDDLVATLEGADGVWRFDVAVAADPRPLSALGAPPSAAAARGGRIVVDGGRAYVELSGGGRVGVVEPGADGALAWAGVVALPTDATGRAGAMAASGPRLAVAAADGASVELWTTADLARPRRLATVTVGEAGRGERVAALAYGARHVYVQIAAGAPLAEFWRLVTLDVADAAAPRIVDRHDMPALVHSAPGGLLGVGDDVVALTRTRWGPNPLQRFDLADPARPVPGAAQSVGMGAVMAAAAAGDGAVVAVADAEDAGVHVVDVEGAAGLSRRGYLDLLGGVTALAADGATFEALDVGGGAPRLHVLRADRPAGGTLAALDAPPDAVRVISDGARRLVLGYGGTVHIVRTVDGQPAVIGRGTLGVQAADVRYAAALDGVVLVPRRGAVDVVELADDGAIRIPASLPVPAVSGQRTLLATGAGRAAVVTTTAGAAVPRSGLSIVDLADPRAPAVRAAGHFDDEVVGAAVVGATVAVVFGPSRRLVTFAIGENGALRPLGLVALGGDSAASSVAGHGPRLYVAGGGQLRRVDLDDPAGPQATVLTAIDGDVAAAAPAPGGRGTAVYLLAPGPFGFARALVVVHDGADPLPPTATPSPDGRPSRTPRPRPTLTPAATVAWPATATAAPGAAVYLPFARRR